MLKNKVVVVTGAAKRIGRSIAIKLAKEGARVAIHYGNSESDARATSEACGGAPIFRADLTQVAEIETLFASVYEHFGQIDGLVNNAARFTRFDPLEITEKDWDFIHSVNLKAVFFCCQQAAKRMPDGGRIVNISSLGGIKPWAHHAHYCASKAGVIHLTKALAKAWGPRRITVNSVAPGVIEFGGTPIESVAQLICKTPVSRSGTPEEIADAVLHFLNASDFVTGQLIAVDGGLSLR